jgi:hypothetical protein
MGINFSCFDILVSKLFLHGADVGDRFQQMRSKGMPQCVAGHVFLNTRPPSRLLDYTVDIGFIDVMAP